MKEFIYPEIDYRECIVMEVPYPSKHFVCEARTTVRKKHTDGKYYLIPVLIHLKSFRGKDIDKIRALAKKECREQAEMFLEKGIVCPHILDMFQQPIHKLDRNQKDD